MSYEIINKDLTTVERGIIVHGCNCQGVMGSGVAKALRSKWPQIFTSYKRMCDNCVSRNNLLGGVSMVQINSELHIANAFTQLYYGKDGRKYADPEAIVTALSSVNGFAAGWASTFDVMMDIYLPKIGCGLGGLDWDTEVEPIVRDISSRSGVQWFVCEY